MWRSYVRRGWRAKQDTIQLKGMLRQNKANSEGLHLRAKILWETHLVKWIRWWSRCLPFVWSPEKWREWIGSKSLYLSLSHLQRQRRSSEKDEVSSVKRRILRKVKRETSQCSPSTKGLRHSIFQEAIQVKVLRLPVLLNLHQVWELIAATCTFLA